MANLEPLHSSNCFCLRGARSRIGPSHFCIPWSVFCVVPKCHDQEVVLQRWQAVTWSIEMSPCFEKLDLGELEPRSLMPFRGSAHFFCHKSQCQRSHEIAHSLARQRSRHRPSTEGSALLPLAAVARVCFAAWRHSRDGAKGTHDHCIPKLAKPSPQHSTNTTHHDSN